MLAELGEQNDIRRLVLGDPDEVPPVPDEADVYSVRRRPIRLELRARNPRLPLTVASPCPDRYHQVVTTRVTDIGRTPTTGEAPGVCPMAFPAPGYFVNLKLARAVVLSVKVMTTWRQVLAHALDVFQVYV